MNNKDRERVERIKVKHNGHSKGGKCKCDMCFLLSILEGEK